jgi:hypothetical protein
MVKGKDGQNLSMNFIIIAAFALLVLVVLSVMFINRTTPTYFGTCQCENHDCESRLVFDDSGKYLVTECCHYGTIYDGNCILTYEGTALDVNYKRTEVKGK